jgi:hypothetical protein
VRGTLGVLRVSHVLHQPQREVNTVLSDRLVNPFFSAEIAAPNASEMMSIAGPSSVTSSML